MTPLTDPLAAIVADLLRAQHGGPAADDRAAQAHVTSLDLAYAVQEHLHAALGPRGASPACWKSGGPSVAGPMLHAPLPARGVRPSGSTLDGLHLRNRWIEAEIALRLGVDVTPGMAHTLTPDDAHSVVDAMAVAIEMVDTRWAAGRAAPQLLKVADLVVHGALVLGPFVPFDRRAWAEQACDVRIGDGAPRAFSGSLGVGDPCRVLPEWLRHVTRDGATAAAGTVVSTGSWCGLLDAAAGDRVKAVFPGIGAASVQL